MGSRRGQGRAYEDGHPERLGCESHCLRVLVHHFNDLSVRLPVLRQSQERIVGADIVTQGAAKDNGESSKPIPSSSSCKAKRNLS